MTNVADLNIGIPLTFDLKNNLQPKTEPKYMRPAETSKVHNAFMGSQVYAS